MKIIIVIIIIVSVHGQQIDAGEQVYVENDFL